ncbi:MAG TPA: YsnF/AvaK domain-containing protein [Ktedonobacterales bacterium]|nr:YsnF/AvaK domain-containing protein [Ktedonobacterales bacterium]
MRGDSSHNPGPASHESPVTGDMAAQQYDDAYLPAGDDHDDLAEQQQDSVPLTHEEVRVEWVAVSDDEGAHPPGPDLFAIKDIEIPLMGERVVIQKRARVVEEVRLHKYLVTERQPVERWAAPDASAYEGQDGIPRTAGTPDTPPPPLAH